MDVPLQVSYHQTEKSPFIDNIIRNHAAHLEEVHDHIISCRVVVEDSHTKTDAEPQYRFRVLVRIPPQKEFVVERETVEGKEHASLEAVIADAFEALTRQLRETLERQRQEVKDHPEQQVQALVLRVFKNDGYGFLKTPEGREIYFHQNSVLNNEFDRLEPGVGVRFSEEEGIKGPQATTVAIVDKPGVRLANTDEEHIEPPLGWEQ